MKRVVTAFLIGVMMLSSSAAFADTVYATKNGKKYHHADCPLIEKKSPAAITMEEALKKGLKPCGKCFKDESAKVTPDGKKSLAQK